MSEQTETETELSAGALRVIKAMASFPEGMGVDIETHPEYPDVMKLHVNTYLMVTRGISIREGEDNEGAADYAVGVLRQQLADALDGLSASLRGDPTPREFELQHNDTEEGTVVTNILTEATVPTAFTVEEPDTE